MNQASSPFFRKFMIIVASLVCVFYLAYRAIYTFNLSTSYAVFASVFLYVGELFGIFNLLLYFLQVWDVAEPAPQPVLEGRTVDVLVPTFNEDVQLLRATLEACVRMDYPHKTYVLDDGRRPEVETLANELGVIYITRANNLHAKAGNLNNALEQTDGEFVVVLDADHVPEPHFITRLIGYFRDERLAYVQTPHAFYNFDSFQARLDHSSRKYWEEGDLFYRVIQPGRNHWNAAIFAGSAAMFRRSALKEIGYIATETVTEDMHTGLRLHAKGWKSIAISERLIVGQAPPDITTFHKQRLRWAEGNLGIMKYDNPLTMAGLTLAQRLCYFGSMIHWASGLFKLAIYMTPILMLFSGVPPVREFTWTLAIVTLTYLFVSLYAMKVVSNGFGSIINSELFSMVNFWTQIKGTFRAIFYRRKEFGVTPKGAAVLASRPKSVWPYVRPQTYIIILSILALFWGWLKLRLDINPLNACNRLLMAVDKNWTISPWIEGTVLSQPVLVGFGISDDYFKPVVPTIWVLIFFWLAYKVTQRAFWPVDRRIATRHTIHIPVEYEVSTAQGTEIRYGVTVDLNDTGMAYIAYEELPKGAILRFTIRGGGEIVKCKGEVRTVAPLVRDGIAAGYRYGIQFQNLTSPQIDLLNRICLHYGVPRMYEAYSRGNRDTLLNRIRNWTGRNFSQRRNAPRNPYCLPIIINAGSTEETTQYSATEDISRVATSAIFDSELPVGTQVGYLLPTPIGDIRGTAQVIRSHPQEYAGRLYYRTVLEFGEFEAQGRTTLQSLVNMSAGGGLGSTLKPDRKSVLPSMRIPIIVACLIAIPLIIAQMAIVFPLYNRDEHSLRKMHEAGGKLSAQQMEEFRRIHRDTMGRSYPSNDRLVLEMQVLIDNFPDTPEEIRKERVQYIDDIAMHLSPRAPEQIDLQKTLLYAYHHTRRWKDADSVFADLKALRDRGKVTDSDWKEVRLEAARIAVDANEPEKASELYDGLLKDDPGLLALRNEYAGMLVRFGEIDKAEQVYRGVNLDITARRLLFDINLQKAAKYPESEDAKFPNQRLVRKEAREAAFSQARYHLDELRKDPRFTAKDEIDADRMLANLYAAQNRYEPAIPVLERLRAATKDESIVIRIAEMQLGMQKPQDALNTIIPLLAADHYTVPAMKVFIDGAASLKRADRPGGLETTDSMLGDPERKYAFAIYDQHRDKLKDDPVYLARLSWVLFRSDESKEKKASRLALQDAVASLQAKTTDNNTELRKEVAGLMMRLGDWDGAKRILGRSDSYEARKLRLDLQLRDKNDRAALDQAIRDADEMIDLFPDRQIEIRKQKANIYLIRNDWDDALNEYKKILQKEPKDPDVHVQIAKVQLYRAIPPGKPGYDPKVYDVALTDFTALLRDGLFDVNAPRLADDFINAAASASILSPVQAEIANKLADQALVAHGGRPEYYSRLAWVLMKVDCDEKARAILNKAIGILPKYEQEQKETEATDEASRKLLLSKQETTRKELAGVLAKAGMNGQAANLIREFVSTPEERLALADLYTGARLWEDALTEVNKVIAAKVAQPLLKRAETLHADIQSWKGDHAKALEEFESLIRKYEDDPDLKVRHAEVLLWSKQYNAALDEFLSLYARYPNKPQIWSGFASTVAAIAGPADGKVPTNAAKIATQISERVLASGNQDPLLLSRLALVMAYLKDPRASQLADKALQGNLKGDPIIKVELAATLAALKRYKEAVDIYKSITNLKAEDRVQYINIASAAEQLDLAAEQARQLVMETANHKEDRERKLNHLVAKRILAQVLSWKGDFAESLALYQELLDVQFEPKDMRLAIAEATIWWRKYSEGLGLFSELIQPKLDQPRIWIGFINAASSSPSMTKGQVQQILYIYDQLKDELKEPELLSRLAWVLIRQQEAAKADHLLRRAVDFIWKDPKDSLIRKELAGVLVARLFPNQVIIPEPNQPLLTRRWLVNEGIKLFKSLDELTELDTKTRIEFVTLLLTSGEKENLELAERVMLPLYRTAPRDDYNIRIRFGELLLYSAKYDITKAKYKRGQVEFKKLVDEIKDPLNPWRELARVRLAQSYLWPGEYAISTPMFQDLLKNIIQRNDETRLRDVWMGYIDTMAGMVGERLRVVKTDEDLDRIRSTLFTDEQKRLLLYCYERANKLIPDPAMRVYDPEGYQEEMTYYTGTLARLSSELAYIGDFAKSREIFAKAVTLSPDRKLTLRMWREYAETLRNIRAYAQAEEIYQRLLAEQQTLNRLSDGR